MKGVQSFYQLLVRPFQYTAEHITEKPGWLSLVCVVLSVVASTLIHSLGGFLIGLMTSVLFLGMILFFQTVLIDFMAQCFGKSAKTLSVLLWFGVGLLPFCLWLPLDMLVQSGWVPWVWKLGKIGVWMMSLVWHIKVVEYSYRVSTFKGLCLYVSPLLLCVGIPIIWIMLVAFSGAL